ncbi:MAG: hypothetical protein CVU48_01050 [Candidatus Cloacimonetes bacterium HGW-Cloacimonetes-1]|jgi:dihydrolipoamide dehydrogenase|nr:MAG: hypothetical protein CVU48_01050 [Candidatus Cloacimonetes bacterium HGW-Cloacimonetes-1]
MDYDLIIIGAGPAGYVSAIRAGQTGLKTLIIDEKYVGGMCLNWGCIPTKSIIESAKLYQRVKTADTFGVDGVDVDLLHFNWGKVKKKTNTSVRKLTKGIEYLWKKNGVEFIQGRASILSDHKVEVDQRILETKYILISTGSKPAVQSTFRAEKTIEIESLFGLETLPVKPIIYGRGSTAVELALFFKFIDIDPILVLTDTPILPIDDEFINMQVDKILKKEKIKVFPINEISVRDAVIVYQEKEYEYDAVVNSSLRMASLPPMPNEIELTDGFITVNEHLQTSIPNIYAVGDVNGKSFLAHSASVQGLAAIDHIHGKVEPVDFLLHPLNIYTEPEIASVGQTEEMLKAGNIEYRVSEFSLNANGKAIIEGNNNGLIRVLHETKYQQVLGVQIVANNATDMIAEASLLLEMEGTIYDLARSVHAHPTISEVFMEVGMIGSDTPVHN